LDRTDVDAATWGLSEIEKSVIYWRNDDKRPSQ
jgi:hypothetical protein